MAVANVATGYHTLTPYFTVKDGVKAMNFYQRALGAKENMRFDKPGGGIMHAEMQIGDSQFMLSEEMPHMGAISPTTLGGATGSFLVQVDNVDEAFKKALAAGGKQMRPVENQFYGDRTGTFEDPEGHRWTLSTHVEDVSIDEMKRRLAAMPGMS